MKRKQPRDKTKQTRRRTRPKEAGGNGPPLRRLVAELEASQLAVRGDRTPRGEKLGTILAEFAKRLADALRDHDPPVAESAVATILERRSEKGAAAVASPAPASEGALLRIYQLERVQGGVARALTIKEQIDDSIDGEDLEYEVGCLELLDDEPMSWLEGNVEGTAIRISFPDDKYYGMPPFLDLEKPRKPQVGQTWRLLRSDRSVAATFILRSIDHAPKLLSTKWQHGDIVRARYEEKVFVARFIRGLDDDMALVHWMIDDLFSEIRMRDILAPSPRKWTREFVGSDVEIA